MLALGVLFPFSYIKEFEEYCHWIILKVLVEWGSESIRTWAFWVNYYYYHDCYIFNLIYNIGLVTVFVSYCFSAGGSQMCKNLSISSEFFICIVKYLLVIFWISARSIMTSLFHFLFYFICLGSLLFFKRLAKGLSIMLIL